VLAAAAAVSSSLVVVTGTSQHFDLPICGLLYSDLLQEPEKTIRSPDAAVSCPSWGFDCAFRCRGCGGYIVVVVLAIVVCECANVDV
jgi:hypothetical protein